MNIKVLLPRYKWLYSILAILFGAYEIIASKDY